jgi:hypothetical protein
VEKFPMVVINSGAVKKKRRGINMGAIKKKLIGK